MADFQPAASGPGRRKLSTPRVDLTPMVDLGFLLITFFMYSTTLAKPKTMEIAVPPRNQPPGTAVPAEATLVIMPAGSHRIAWYPGTVQDPKKPQWCAAKGSNSLRQLLEKETSRVRALPASFSPEAHKLHVLIKPDTSASFDEIVGALDEMNITAVPSYTLMHITKEEQEAIKIFR